MRETQRRLFGILTLILLLGGTCWTGAQEIWSGDDLLFVKDEFVDWTQAEHQDRLTENVWLTRADTKGIFNIAIEDEFDNMGFLSPLDTEWATGSALNWDAYTYDTWDNWHGAAPLSVIGVDAVVHLITDDIYIDIRFESWSQGDGQGGASGGGMTYWRGADPTASYTGTWSAVKTLY